MASAGEVEVAPLCFSVKHAGLSLKITLDAKWQKKSLLVSVVAPFIKSFNKKRPEYDALHEDGLAGILADGATWLDPMRHAADAVPPQTAAVELHFEPRASMDGRPCRVGCGETELKIELDRKWLRQSFQNAVIGPFVTTYNKRNASPLVPAALDVAALSALSIDDGAPLTEELGALLAKPAALVLPMGTKRVDLAFGAVGSASLVAQPSVVTGAGGGGAGGGAGGGQERCGPVLSGPEALAQTEVIEATIREASGWALHDCPLSLDSDAWYAMIRAERAALGLSAPPKGSGVRL